MTVTAAQVAEAERKVKFVEPPPYGVLAVEERNGRIHSYFTTHNSLRAVKTHITSCNTVYDSWTGRKTTATEIVARAHYRVYEYHGSQGWIPVYDIPDGCQFKKDHELWKAKAPTEKVAAPDDDVAAAIASIVGVGGQQENES
jgi:hypothetical protein